MGINQKVHKEILMIKLNKWKNYRWIIAGTASMAAVAFIVVIILLDLSPFGTTINYETNFSSNLKNVNVGDPFATSAIAVKDGEGGVCQIPTLTMTRDRVTFGIKTPYEILDEMEFKIVYESDPGELLLGLMYPDEQMYHYYPIHNKTLNNLSWESIEKDGVMLFQKNETFESIQQFQDALPQFVKGENRQEESISSYYYSLEQPRDPNINEKRINEGIEIDTTLRGAQDLFVYVKDKPLEITFDKQDLNSIDGDDPLHVWVMRAGERVYSLRVPDDGNIKPDNRVSGPQEVRIEVPDLPEGNYEVKIGCGNDLLLKDIKSRQKYLVFRDRVFVADHELYKIDPGKGTVVYADAQNVGLEIWHEEAIQTVTINSTQQVPLATMGKVDVSVASPAVLNSISIVESSMAVTGGGYFTFSADSYFNPTPIKVSTFNKYFNPSNSDYLIAGYTVPEQKENKYYQKIHINLNYFNISKNTLDFFLEAPDIESRGEEVVIDSIEIILRKH